MLPTLSQGAAQDFVKDLRTAAISLDTDAVGVPIYTWSALRDFQRQSDGKVVHSMTMPPPRWGENARE